MALLGGLLLKPQQVFDAIGTLDSSEFYDPFHRTIYTAIREIVEENRGTDLKDSTLVLVKGKLQDQGLLTRIGGPAKLLDLQAGAPSTTGATAFATRIAHLAVRRKLIETAATIEKLGYTEWDAVKAVTRANDELKGLLKITNRDLRLVDMVEMVDAHLDELEDRASGHGLGFMTGWVDLDESIGGWRPGELIVAAGRPGMGKTIMGCNLAMEASRQDYNTLFISMEMPMPSIMDRFTAAVSRVPLKVLRSGDLNGTQWGSVSVGHGKLMENHKVNLVAAPAVTIEQVATWARRVDDGRPLFIVIDYLQLMGSRGGTRQEEVAIIARGLKNLGLEMNAIVVALSQFSRALELRLDKRPMMADLRESGEIENAADLILGLYRDDYYDERSERRGIVEVLVLKARNAEICTVDLAFLGDTARMVNMAKVGDAGRGNASSPSSRTSNGNAVADALNARYGRE